MHLKRPNTSKIWPIPRKGTKYLVVPAHSKEDGIPVLILMREVLGFVKTRKELVKVLREGKILINDAPIKDEKRTLLLFDTLSIPSMNKYYRIEFSDTRKIKLEEINEKESHSKITKLVNKTKLKGGKNQLNFNDGRNLISDEKVSVGDSVKIKFKDNKIEKVIPILEKGKLLVTSGKHRGEKVIVESIGEKINVKSGNSNFEINKKEVIAIE